MCIRDSTCVELLERGYEVVVVDNLYNSSEVALERVQEITGKTLKFYKGDILNREDLEPIFENEEIEAVINFAGLKACLLYTSTGTDPDCAERCQVQTDESRENAAS